MVQVTVAKIKGYGPWTLTLGSDREHRLQMLQASLYAEAQRLFSESGCLVFPNRYDEYMIVSNGLGEAEHRRIQESLADSFEVRLEMHAGRGSTPYEANLMAHRAKRDGVFASGGNGDAGEVTIMHMDVDDLTSETESTSPYGIASKVLELHLAMAKYFAERESLSFFMGGDNFMVVAGPRGREDAGDFVSTVRDDMGITLNCGIGRAPTGRRAAMLATKSLDTIRKIRDEGGPKPEVYESDC